MGIDKYKAAQRLGEREYSALVKEGKNPYLPGPRINTGGQNRRYNNTKPFKCFYQKLLSSPARRHRILLKMVAAL